MGALSFFEKWVWLNMMFEADDFGVLPDRAMMLVGADNSLEAEESRRLGAVRAAMDTVIEQGLFIRFEHQGQPFLCDPKWQDFQKIQYPRKTTYNPAPPLETLEKLSEKTRQLFEESHPSLPICSLLRQSTVLQAKGKRLKARGSEEGGVGETTPAGFVEFWKLYPKRVGKDAALRKWRERNCERIADGVIASLKGQMEYLLRDGGQYIPNPATWLHQGRWKDEVPDARQGMLTPKTAGNAEAVRAFVEGRS